MNSLWNDIEAARFQGDLAQRVYTSRLLGRDQSLVLHGGGNTSVKICEKDILGAEEEILYVKGSGWDLEHIDERGFAPVRMSHLLKLASLSQLSDPQMVNELKTHMTRADAPTPSVEAILHAVLPHKFVDHTHADALVTLTNTSHGPAHVREVYGDAIVVIPYVMPGFDLAREVALRFPQQAGPQTLGMVLLNHGIFSFGATARESYERMIELVDRAERFLARRHAWQLSFPVQTPPATSLRHELADLRLCLSKLAGTAMILHLQEDDKSLFFARHPDATQISQQGPATPDHVIRTKALPMLGRDVEAYVDAYRTYFDRHAPQARAPKTMLDPTPRVILDQDWGLITVGRSAQDVAIVRDIYAHTIDVILRAETLGGYRALPAQDLFDMEYWDLEQAKLHKGGKPPEFNGEIALVTGAASGIGKACVEALLTRGAAVIGLDINPGVADAYNRPSYLGLSCDVTDSAQVAAALERGVRHYGGLDMLVLNAGLFPGGCLIASLGDEEWHRVMAVNLDANLGLLRETYPLLKRSPGRGRVAVIGSKNVIAPGPGAAAYSASKAALVQLARVTALEWAGDGIRINIVHPDAVFDTGLWSAEVLQARAAHYRMTVQEYKSKNLLKVETESRDVAELAAALLSPLFAKTTGAQIPIDGGNDRVI